jgi:hypothetical protein
MAQSVNRLRRAATLDATSSHDNPAFSYVVPNGHAVQHHLPLPRRFGLRTVVRRGARLDNSGGSLVFDLDVTSVS